MASRRPPLHLEELGARILPSATLVDPPPAATALASPSCVAVHILDGHGHGRYTSDAVQSGAGIEYRLSGHADLAGLGQVKMTGSVHSVGFIQKGRAGGTLTFTNTHGSVTVELQGPEQAGFSPLPERFRYHVVGGSGAYAHLSDSGTLALSQHALPTGDRQGAHGTFTLSIPGSPIPTGAE